MTVAEARAGNARTPVDTWLVHGLPGSGRATQLQALLRRAAPDARISVILEGAVATGEAELPPRENLRVHVLAPGCVCCIGNLTLRVTLARVLQREAPDMLLLAIADTRHLGAVQSLLRGPPYGALLRLHDV